MKKIPSNVILLFKQGLKGVFKFKIQFIIILILSFLATLILTITLSVSARLTNDYNNIVKKVDRFNYSSTMEIYENGEDGANRQYDVPLIYDFINSDLNSTIVGGKTTTNYNITFNDYYFSDAYDVENKFTFEETFLTRLYKGETISTNESQIQAAKDFKQTFSTMNNDALSKTNTQASILNNEILYSLKEFKDSNAKNETYFKNTTMGEYILKNNFDFEKIIKHNNGETQELDIKSLELLQYVHYTSISVLAFQYNSFNEFLKNSTNPENIGETFYEFLTGYQFSEEKAINDSYIVTKDNNYVKHANLDTLNFGEDQLLNIAITSQDENNQDNLLIKGFRGISSPISATKTDDKIVGLSIYSKNTELFLYNGKDDSNRFLENMSSSDDYRFTSGSINKLGVNQIESISRGALFQKRISIIAEVNNFKANFRKEMFAFDSISQTKYRAVVLNDEDMKSSNFTIIEGRMPVNVNEIAISQQYAKAHKIDLGKKIKVGNAIFTIVAIATDAYSYFPQPDKDFPVPQPKVSAILYGKRDTLENMRTGTSSSEADRTVKYSINFFLTSKSRDINVLENQINRFNAMQFSIKDKLIEQFDIVNRTSTSKFGQTLNVVPFKSSEFSKNWTLQPMVMNIYNIVTIISSIIIGVIAIVALIICIKKTIDFNSKQIGILKALGITPQSIAASYLGHSVIITLFVIPLGWLAGNLLQIPFARLFGDYFSSPYNGLQFDFVSLAIAFTVLGIFSMIISFVFAYLTTNTSVMEILKNSVKWSNSKIINSLKNTAFKNSKFTLKFSLTLASSGKKSIILLVAVVGISSIFISTGLAIPAVANSVKTSFYANTKFANSYSNIEPAYNSPFAKGALNFWNGHDELDKDFNKNPEDMVELDERGNKYGYYIDPENYSASSNDVSPISKYVYLNDGQTQTIDHSLKEAVSNPEGLLDLIMKMFGNNFYSVNGQAFSIGMIDQLFGILLNSLNDPQDSGEQLTDDEKIRNARDFSTFLTQGIPEILKAVVGSTGGSTGSSNPNDTWKQQIISIILTLVPPFVRSYLDDGSRLEQFSIAYNVEHYSPENESLATIIDVKSSESKNFSLTGLDKNQNAYSLYSMKDEIKNNPFLDYETSKKVEKVFNNTWNKSEDIFFNGWKIYDSSKNQLWIPTVINEQAKAGYKLPVGGGINDISTDASGISYVDNDGNTNPLPNQAWIYDDINFLKSDYYKNNSSQGMDDLVKFGKGVIENEDSRYLNPFELDSNKFTNDSLYTNVGDTTKLNNKSSMFNDFAVSDNEIKGAYVRPYYRYDDLKLFIPKAEILNTSGLKDFLFPNGALIPEDLENIDSYTDWFDTTLKGSEVPKSVKTGYDLKYSDNNTEWVMVKPFNLSYSLGDEREDGIGNIVNHPSYWFYDAFKNEKSVMRFGKTDKQSYLNKDLKIGIKVVDKIKSYDSSLFLADMTFTNLMKNYSLSKKIGLNNSIFEKDQVLKAGEKDSNGYASQFDRYPLRNFNDDIVMLDKEEWSTITFEENNALENAPMMWHNAKLSNFEEPVGLTSGISFVPSENHGQFSIGLGSAISVSPVLSMIDSQTLLSTQKALMDQITLLAISIGMLLIVAVVITAALLIMLVGDIYISQYQRFMILMKALGYSNWKVQKYAFGTVTIFSLIVWALATVLAWGTIAIGIYIVYQTGFAIPYGFTWWPPLISFIVTAVSFIGSLLISSGKARNGNPASLMTGSSE
ncbi:ABC transporter permease [Mesoplasma photuris]|uniref:ABC transporter permease n=1 Tax=Mesoplasma photuris TaxID=217731 RepID=UPI0004E2853C|nr:ABC transporter permease [Mesoplasma photuris]